MGRIKAGTVCRVIAAAALATAIAAVLIGCSMLESERAKARLADALECAYAFGGREAVSNRIDGLVLEGKLTPEEAVRLRALARVTYESVLASLEGEGGEACAPSAGSAGLCEEAAEKKTE